MSKTALAMSKVAFAMGVGSVLLGVSVAVYPAWFFSVDWASRSGLYIAAAIRVVAGLVFFTAAPASRFPTVFRVIGVIALVAAVILLVLPINVWAAFMGAWMEQPGFFRVLLAATAIPAGAFIAWASRRRDGAS